MKAKEYAARLTYKIEAKANNNEVNPDVKALIDIIFEFINEWVDLTHKRGIKTDAAALACWKEMENKYHAFSRIASCDAYRIDPNGLRIVLQDAYPDMYKLVVALESKFGRNVT